MGRNSQLAAAYALDWIVGDPEWVPHPVRLMGWAGAAGERALRRLGSGSRRELAAGGLLAVGVPVVSALVAWRVIGTARARHRVFGQVVATWLGATCLATRNLLEEGREVIRALDDGDLRRARKRLRRIVGRDTESLDEPEICRAVIETLAESLSDGIIAPLFYLAVGGVPAAMAYKAINTLDSMIGHRDTKYLWFGRVAAHLDDAANWIPARMSAALTCLAAGIVCNRKSAVRALHIWLRDGSHHASPNAGHAESAMAGALAVRLGGTNCYDGERIVSPYLGGEFQKPDRNGARRALGVVAAASLLGFAVACLLTWRRPHGE